MDNFDSKKRLIKASYNQDPLQSLNEIFKSLNLNPAFQRKSVWEISDRKKFISTILEGMPCPTIFLFKRWDKKKKKYINDVIDGKQRLETIFLFCNKLSPNKINVSQERKKKIKDWVRKFNFNKLSTTQQQNFWAFNMPIGHIELKDEDGSEQGIADVIEAFIRINTQGKPLSRQERTNAAFIEKPVLKLAINLSNKFNDTFYMTSEQKSRMKDTEITLELLLSIRKEEVLNKKSAIDKAVSEDISNKELKEAQKKFLKICGVIKKLDLGKNTRFIRKTSDYYSLFVALTELDNSNIVFHKKGYLKAKNEISDFSAEIAEITNAHQSKNYRYLKKITNTPYYRYWLTTQRNTDSKENRIIRRDILKEILFRAFTRKKDKNRFFSVTQKEQVWHNSKNKKCAYPGCEKILRWENATVDHIIPWSIGGSTDISNAQLMCRKHNSMKKDKEFSKFFISH